MDRVKCLIKKMIISSKILSKLVCCLNEKLSLLEVASLTNYCEDNGLIIKMIDERNERLTRAKAVSVEAYEENVYGFVKRPVSKSYIAQVKEGSFIGETDGVFIDGKYLLERIEWDKGGVCNYLPNNIIALREDRCIFNKKDLNDRRVEKGIVLLKMWSNNIFHFTFEVIARLIAIDRYYKDGEVPILVDEIVKNDLRSMKLLEMVNIYNRRIIWVKKNERVTLETAILPPCMAWGTFDQKILNDEGHGWILDEKSARMVRGLVLKDYLPKRRYNKVYVARGNDDRLANESELIQILVRNGFDIFYPDVASFEEEVDCFSTANCIVLCAGAAVTNTIYCKSDVILFQICPWEFQCATGAPIEDVSDFKINKISGKLIKKGNAMNLSKFVIEQTDIIRIINAV